MTGEEVDINLDAMEWVPTTFALLKQNRPTNQNSAV